MIIETVRVSWNCSDPLRERCGLRSCRSHAVAAQFRWARLSRLRWLRPDQAQRADKRPDSGPVCSMPGSTRHESHRCNARMTSRLLRVDIDEPMVPIRILARRAPSIASFLVSPGRTGRPLGIGVVGVKQSEGSHTRADSVSCWKTTPAAEHWSSWFGHRAVPSWRGSFAGDRIVAINGQKASSKERVVATLRGHVSRARSVRLTILRPNDVKVLEVHGNGRQDSRHGCASGNGKRYQGEWTSQHSA